MDVEEVHVYTHMNVLYVGQQINRDLWVLSTAYPNKLPMQQAMDLFNSYTTFLANNAIGWLGFSIHDPVKQNLVYHEYRYEVHYDGEVHAAGGTGGREVKKVALPGSAVFTPWVIWSDHMQHLSVREQELIVKGTGWNIPGRNGTFNGRYVDGEWVGLGNYQRGALRVGVTEYRYSS
jgi:hypothetical protein